MAPKKAWSPRPAAAPPSAMASPRLSLGALALRHLPADPSEHCGRVARGLHLAGAAGAGDLDRHRRSHRILGFVAARLAAGCRLDDRLADRSGDFRLGDQRAGIGGGRGGVPLGRSRRAGDVIAAGLGAASLRGQGCPKDHRDPPCTSLTHRIPPQIEPLVSIYPIGCRGRWRRPKSRSAAPQHFLLKPRLGSPMLHRSIDL